MIRYLRNQATGVSGFRWSFGVFVVRRARDGVVMMTSQRRHLHAKPIIVAKSLPTWDSI